MSHPIVASYKGTCIELSGEQIPSVIINDAITRLLNVRKSDGESLQDYTKRFKNLRGVTGSTLGGPLIILKMVESIQGYGKGDNGKRKQYKHTRSPWHLYIPHELRSGKRWLPCQHFEKTTLCWQQSMSKE